MVGGEDIHGQRVPGPWTAENDPELRRQVRVAVTQLLQVCQDAAGSPPALPDVTGPDDPAARVYRAWFATWSVCLQWGGRRAARDGLYEASSETMEFGTVPGLVNEVRVQVLRPIVQVLRAGAAAMDSNPAVQRWVVPLRAQVAACVAELDRIYQLVVEERRRRGRPLLPSQPVALLPDGAGQVGGVAQIPQPRRPAA